MNKFTFTSSFTPDHLDSSNTASKTTVEFEAEALSEVLRKFADFLRGSGFCFDGEVDIVDNSLPLFDDKTDDIAPCTDVKGTFMVDPPSGWQYGFPRPYNKETDGPFKEFLIKNGYPEKDATWASENTRSWIQPQVDAEL